MPGRNTQRMAVSMPEDRDVRPPASQMADTMSELADKGHAESPPSCPVLSCSPSKKKPNQPEPNRTELSQKPEPTKSVRSLPCMYPIPWGANPKVFLSTAYPSIEPNHHGRSPH
jgi:hypothetical protein